MKGAARLIGVCLFLAGVAMIFAVFFMTRNLYATPLIGQNAKDALVDRLGEAAVSMFVRALLLIVMSVCGALIASKGVQLYLATLPHEGRMHAQKKRPHGEE